jgi:hypothetical protein
MSDVDEEDGEEYPCDEDDDNAVDIDYGEDESEDEDLRTIRTIRRPSKKECIEVICKSVSAVKSTEFEKVEKVKETHHDIPLPYSPQRPLKRPRMQKSAKPPEVVAAPAVPVQQTTFVPIKCPVLKVPYPQTLLQAEDAYQKSLPDAKFMKRMRITTEKCSLLSFVVHKINNENVSSGKAPGTVNLTLDEKDSTYDEHVCEQCNEVKILDSRTAQSVCLKCGESSTYLVPDTSFREGVSIHTPYCKYFGFSMHRNLSITY